MANNFLPNITCPHCKATLVVAISGFGGELNTRKKLCSKCNKEFFVHVLVQTSVEKEIPDGYINQYKASIKSLQAQRRVSLAEQLIKHETAVKLNKEAMVTATEMWRKNSMN